LYHKKGRISHSKSFSVEDYFEELSLYFHWGRGPVQTFRKLSGLESKERTSCSRALNSTRFNNFPKKKLRKLFKKFLGKKSSIKLASHEFFYELYWKFPSNLSTTKIQFWQFKACWPKKKSRKQFLFSLKSGFLKCLFVPIYRVF